MTTNKETISDIIKEKSEIAANMQQPCEQNEKQNLLHEVERLKAAYNNEFEIMHKLCDTLIQCELFMGYVCKHAHPRLNPGDECIACKDKEEIRNMICKSLKLLEQNGVLTFE